MKIQVEDIEASPKALDYAEEVDELNARLTRGVPDYHMPAALGVHVSYYRAGLDLFFEGTARGQVHACCARCAEEYSFSLDAPFRFVLTPRAAGDPAGTELGAEDLALSFYEGKEVDLTPLVHEQIILALPTRPLCREDCRGLCPRCGTNLNAGPCGCAPAMPRLAALSGLPRGR
ncbi:MAG TPA: DUF177 domain-containing protein [Candidatus Binatia bacterium]|nr:DUF177 domain-containing protein [Candidatus Binatia bacterium]